MAEYEELRLTVTLVDNASQGLATLRQNLRALGGNENREQLTRMQREVEGLTERMGRVRTEMGRTSTAAQTLGRTIAGAVTTFATAFVSHFAIDSLRRFTDEMVRLDGTAKQFGVGGATIKNIVDQMKLMGIDAGAASNLVTNFATSLAEMSRQGSRIRQELMKGAVSDPAAMAAFISRITGFASRGEMEKALNEVVEAANNAFQAELARTGGNEIMAAENRNRFLKTLGLDDATMAMIKGRFQETTEEQRAQFAQRSAIAQAFSKEWNEMDKKSQDFIRGLQEGLLPLIRELNSLIGQTGESFGNALAQGFGQFGKDIASIVKTIQLIREGKYGEAIKEGLGFQWKNPAAWPDEAPDWILPPEKMSYGGGVGSNEMPPLIRASLGGGEPIMNRSSGQTEFTRAIRTGTFDALVDFKNFMQGGGGAAGGGGGGSSGGGDSGGAMKASLTTGGPSGGGGYPSAPPSGGAPSTAPPPSGDTTRAPGSGDYPGSKLALAAPGGAPVQGALGVSPEQYDVFRRSVAQLESGGRYGLKGGSSNRFSGAYQFGSAEIAETAKSLGEPTPSREQFLSDPAMQERYMGKYTENHHNQLMKRSPEYRAMNAEQRLAVLGYAHNQGVGGAAKWLRTGRVGADAFGTRGTKYSEAIRRNLVTPPGQSRVASADQALRDMPEEADPAIAKNYEAIQEALKANPEFGYPEGENPNTPDRPRPGVIEERIQRGGDLQQWSDEEYEALKEKRRQRLKGGPDVEGGGTPINYRSDFDRDLGREVTSRVEASGSVTVDVSGGAPSKGAARAKLFSKMTIQRPRQMAPAEAGPSHGDENGVSI